MNTVFRTGGSDWISGMSLSVIDFLVRKKSEEAQVFIKNLREFRDNFAGVVFEIESITGTWRRKDQIIPRIVSEWLSETRTFNNQIDEYIEKFYSRDDIPCLEGLLLVKRLNEKFEFLLSFDELSAHYSHKTLDRALRRIKARINNAIDQVLEVYNLRAKQIATNQFYEEFNQFIKNRTSTSTILELQDIKKWASKFYNEVVVNHFDWGYNVPHNLADITDLFMKQFKPSYSDNCHLALEPIYDNSTFQILYFNNRMYNKEYHKETSIFDKWVITRSPPKPIADKAKNRYNYEGAKTYSEIFIEHESEYWLKNWFKSKEVKKRLIKKATIDYLRKIKSLYQEDEGLLIKPQIFEKMIEVSDQILEEEKQRLLDVFGLSYENEDYKEIYAAIVEEFTAEQDLSIFIENAELFKKQCMQLYPSFNGKKKGKKKKVRDPLYIVDLETTGLDGCPDDDIVEIAICKIDFEKKSSELLYNSVIKSDKANKDTWIINNSTLTLEDIEKGKDPEIAVKEVQELLKDKHVTSFNTAFDFGRFLHYKPWDLRSSTKKDFCLMHLSTGYCKLPGHNGYKWPKLEEAYSILVDEKDPELEKQQHRAKEDIEMSSAVLLAIYNRQLEDLRKTISKL